MTFTSCPPASPSLTTVRPGPAVAPYRSPIPELCPRPSTVLAREPPLVLRRAHGIPRNVALRYTSGRAPNPLGAVPHEPTRSDTLPARARSIPLRLHWCGASVEAPPRRVLGRRVRSTALEYSDCEPQWNTFMLDLKVATLDLTVAARLARQAALPLRVPPTRSGHLYRPRVLIP